MKLSELFSLHLDFRALRLLSGTLSDAEEIERCTLLCTTSECEPGSLVLGAGLQLPRDEVQLCAMLRMNVLPPAAAVLVRAATDYDPAPLHTAASPSAPPLLSVPLSASADDVLELVQAALRGQTAYLNHLHTLFLRRSAPMLAESRCPSAVLTLLYEYLRVPLFLFSRQYALPERCCSGEYAAEAARAWQQAAGAPDQIRQVAADGRLCLFLPVFDSQFPVADLCAVYPADRPPAEADLLLLRAALPHIGFLMQRSALHRPFLYQQELPFFHAVLTDRFNGQPELLAENAANLGLICDRPRLLLLLEAKPADAFGDAACRTRIAGYLEGLSKHGHLFRHSGRLLFMTECAAPQKALAEFRTTVLPQLRRVAGSAFLPALGIGCSACFPSLREMPNALAEAEFSLHMGEKSDPDAMLYVYEDYMLYHLLSSIKETPAISLIYSEVITVLQDYDRQNGTDLLDTLLNLCRNNFNTIQTANQMYLHRNSLYKRVTRISEILDMDLDLPDNLITLHLAARLHELLGGKEAL